MELNVSGGIKLNSLKDGDEIKYRTHETSKVVVCLGLSRLMNKYGGQLISNYYQNLTHKTNCKFDIIKVIRDGKVIFDRKGIESVNYLQKLMADNKLSINEKFVILDTKSFDLVYTNDNKNLFYFDEHYNLKSINGQPKCFHNSILKKLLTGRYLPRVW